MIRAATSPSLKRAITSAADLFGLARRFAGRSDVPQAISAARRLRSLGLRSSLFYLGEYARDASVVEEIVTTSIAAARALGSAGLDVHVSVDPTSIGCLLDNELGRANARRIAAAVRDAGGPGPSRLMIDMEDYSLVERTLSLECELAAAGLPVGVTLQAYLHRSSGDLASIIRRGGHVLLVKGAFAEPEPHAWQQRSDIDASYARLARRMLSEEARDAKFRPAFGTHDERLISEIQSVARERGWLPGAYEFEFLYGVKMVLAKRLASEGEVVRLYLPFGIDWWPYVARRIGENPRYVRNLVTSGDHDDEEL